MRSLLILFAIRLSSRFLRGLRSVFSVRVAIQSRDFCWHVLTRFFMFGFLRLTSCLNWFCLNVNHVRRLWKLNFNFQYLFLFGLFACWCYHAQGKIFEESCQSKNIELFNKPRIVQTWMNIWSAISSTQYLSWKLMMSYDKGVVFESSFLNFPPNQKLSLASCYPSQNVCQFWMLSSSCQSICQDTS